MHTQTQQPHLGPVPSSLAGRSHWSAHSCANTHGHRLHHGPAEHSSACYWEAACPPTPAWPLGLCSLCAILEFTSSRGEGKAWAQDVSQGWGADLPPTCITARRQQLAAQPRHQGLGAGSARQPRECASPTAAGCTFGATSLGVWALNAQAAKDREAIL